MSLHLVRYAKGEIGLTVRPEIVNAMADEYPNQTIELSEEDIGDIDLPMGMLYRVELRVAE